MQIECPAFQLNTAHSVLNVFDLKRRKKLTMNLVSVRVFVLLGTIGEIQYFGIFKQHLSGTHKTAAHSHTQSIFDSQSEYAMTVMSSSHISMGHSKK